MYEGILYKTVKNSSNARGKTETCKKKKDKGKKANTEFVFTKMFTLHRQCKQDHQQKHEQNTSRKFFEARDAHEIKTT